jgi:carbonic anhydrase
MSTDNGNSKGVVLEQLLKANEEYSTAFTPEKAALPLPPGRKVLIVVCMDARIDPAKALGLQEGDAHVVRNAGGRVVEALRSISISQQLLGTQEVAVIHHTDCGMLTFSDQQLRDTLRSRLGANADHVAFLPFNDLDQSVRDDLAIYHKSEIVRQDVPVRGFVYDVKTGKLREVVPHTHAGHVHKH